jgi:aquaporin Z
VQKYLTEFVGTFFLTLTVCLTVLGRVPLAPLAIGCSLMVMVYMGGHVSGAHYNPAVSLAVWLRGKLTLPDFGIYVAAQVVGAIVAALVASFVLNGYVVKVGTTSVVVDRSFALAPGEGVSVGAALLVEVLYTFALALVVLNVATAKKTEGNSFYGLAIGFTVVVAAFAGGGISGGAFNPAVGTGPTLVHAMVGSGSLADLWIYWVGPLAGGALAAGVFRLQEEGFGPTPGKP